MVAETKPRPSNDDRIRAALWFAERGFGIFPVWSTKVDGACRCPAGKDCGSPGKHPITPQGFKDSTTDPALIRTFLSAASQPNYGMLPPEGVFAWDVDTDEERDRLERLEAVHGPLPRTLTVVTAHGQHIFIKWPDGVPRPLHKPFGIVTRFGSGKLAGYVIGPRSVHASGAEYAPAEGTVWDIATLPDAWAHAAVADAVPEPSGTVRLVTDREPGSVHAGGRHDFLRDRARALRGSGLEGDDLFVAVSALNERYCDPPKTPDEVRRAIGDVETRFDADPVVQDPVTGEYQPSIGTSEPSHTKPLSDDAHFPADMNAAAYSGLLGECVDFLQTGTDASRVGLLASLVAFCGALMPVRGYWNGWHTSSPFLALVGKQGIGRKGTAMFRVRDALAHALEPRTIEDIRFDGIASGEALVKTLLQRDRDTKGVPTGVLFEEEYETFLAASGREGSNLDSRMRAAFDGKQLSLRKVGDTMIVAEPYWLSGLVGITPSALQAKFPQANFRNGSGTRWLWLPVVRRDVRVVSQEPIFPTHITSQLVDAHHAAMKAQPRIMFGPEVDDLLSEYDAYLRAETVGTAARLTVRYGVIAFRIALVHAAVNRAREVTTAHVMAAIAMTEYARSGIRFAFGDTAGDLNSTHLLRLLLDSDDGTIPQHIISKYVIRDFIKRQMAFDELQDLGIAEVVKVPTKGRAATLLRLIPRNRGFRDFSALFGYEQKPDIEHPTLDERGENGGEVRRSPDPRLQEMHEGAQKVGEPVDATGAWAKPCRDYSSHQASHRRTPEGWVCDVCIDSQ